MKVSPIKDIAARVLAKYLPDVTLHNELRFEHLSRDPQMLKAYQQDPLRHERASANLYLGMIEHMKYVNQNANRLRTPLLMQVAGHDMIVSAAASQAFFEKVTMVDKTLHVYTDSYHEIYNDLGYEAVFADLRKFLSRFVVPK
jgi:alpha-beta hydrolase superfamily lysophospholipase